MAFGSFHYSFNVAAYALIPVAVGFFMYFAGKAERTKNIGLMIMGLGLEFYGIKIPGLPEKVVAVKASGTVTGE